MMSGIHSVKHKRREFSHKVGWRFPHLCLVAMCYCDIPDSWSCELASETLEEIINSLSIRTKTASKDFCFEIDIMQDCAFLEMHKHSSTIWRCKETLSIHVTCFTA